MNESALLVGAVFGWLVGRSGRPATPVAPADAPVVVFAEVIGLLVGVRYADAIVDDPSEGMRAVVGAAGWWAAGEGARMFTRSAVYSERVRPMLSRPGASAPVPAPVPAPAPQPQPQPQPPVSAPMAAGIASRT